MMMTLIRGTVLAFVGVVALNAQTTDSFRIFRNTANTQSSLNSTSLESNPYQLFVEVAGANLGSYSTRTLTRPGGTTNSFFATPDGTRATYTGSFASEINRDTAFAAGTYSLTLGAATASLDIANDVSPNTPTILGGTWLSNRLQVSDGGYTLNFATPTNTDSVRLRIYQQSDPFNVYSYTTGGSSTSILIPDADLTLGMNYGAFLYFYNVNDTDTAFGAAAGTAGYMTTNFFQFTVVAAAVPEPSTYALITGAVFLFGALARRRLRGSAR
jgi:hypothetical protein